MFEFLFKKERQVESLIYQYLDTLQSIQENFVNALFTCMETPHCENFEFLIKQTHKYESKADDIREEIKSLMYGKALIPDSRGDIMGLIESIDAIPGLLENILHIIHTQKLTIPDLIARDVRELVNLSMDCCDLLLRQATALFKKTGGIRALVSSIDTNESHCDHIERRIITRVFESDLDPFLKLQLKELVVKVGDISDQADRVSKRINILSMKRRV